MASGIAVVAKNAVVHCICAALEFMLRWNLCCVLSRAAYVFLSSTFEEHYQYIKGTWTICKQGNDASIETFHDKCET